MSIEYKIQNAQPKDATGLASLAQRGFKGYPFESVYDPISLAGNIAKGEIRIIALLQPDLQRIIGTAVLGVDGLMAEIKRVIVDPDYRKNGLAKDMTIHLAQEAEKRHAHPYTDTRADQIGMQRSSLGAGLKAVSIETGKHVVFDHRDGDDKPVGPARESMVHMTSLEIPSESLYEGLRKWPPLLAEKLIENMEKAQHNPEEKNREVATTRLPSAQKVREKIYGMLSEAQNGFQVLYDEQDVTIISHGNIKMTIIKPDASGFLETNELTSKEDLEYVLRLSEAIGLQIVTGYENVHDGKRVLLMSEDSLIPAMVRPWQVSEKKAPEWQVGFRKTMNDYDQCLHHIRLDETVRRQLEEFVQSV